MPGVPADENLSLPKLFTLGIQHVLVMYAGAVAVPLIIGRALKLQPEEVAFLISADLFACGLATLVQSIGFPWRHRPMSDCLESTARLFPLAHLRFWLLHL
jgi:xanthine/uracil permease